MASRVVPASGATTCRSSPSSRLTSEDFPAFGPPDHRDVDRLLRPRPDRTAAAARRRRRAGRRCPSPPRRSRPAGRRSRAGRSRTARCCARGRRACSPRAPPGAAPCAAVPRWPGPPGCMPSRPSTTNTTTSDSSSANSTCCRMARSIESSDSGTRPPVSTSQNWRPCHSASPKCRSRVVPGPVGDDGRPAADDAVEQGGLADVGPADDGDGGLAHAATGSCSASMKSLERRSSIGTRGREQRRGSCCP